MLHLVGNISREIAKLLVEGFLVCSIVLNKMVVVLLLKI